MATNYVTMINLTKICDTRRTKRDGTHPIIFRVTLKGKTRDITTGHSCLHIQWNNRKNCLKSGSEEFEILSQRLRDQELILLEKIKDYETRYPNNNSVQDIKDYLVDKQKTAPTVLQFWIEEIARLTKGKYFGNARNYKSALDGISKRVSLKLSFDKIDYKWLVELETNFRATGLKTNSISIYLRKLRSIYNKAINYGLAEANNYPFRRYKIKSESTSPRVISIEELEKYFKLNLGVDDKLFNAWCVGKLIFLLRGINFIDLAMLTSENIKQGRIIYKRAKTKKIYTIEVLPEVVGILSHFKDSRRDTLLPILTNVELDESETRLERIRQQRKNYNKVLNTLGKNLNLSINLSSYVFRFSHANACKNLGYSKDLIGESLGHNYGMNVTSLYLEDYNIELVDEMNKTVCKMVVGGM